MLSKSSFEKMVRNYCYMSPAPCCKRVEMQRNFRVRWFCMRCHPKNETRLTRSLARFARSFARSLSTISILKWWTFWGDIFNSACMCMYVCFGVYLCVCVCMCVCVYVCVCVLMCAHVYACMCVYVCIYVLPMLIPIPIPIQIFINMLMPI